MQTLVSLAHHFWLNRSKSNKFGTPIYCRIKVNSVPVDISTGKYINPDRWHKGQLMAVTKEDKMTNDFLSKFRAMIISHYDDMVIKGLPITAELLKKKILGITEKKMSFLEVFNWFMDEMREKVQAGDRAQATVDKYGFAKDKFIACLQHKFNKSDILLDSIREDLVFDFEHYMKTKCGLVQNTANKYVNLVKQVLTFAKRKKKITSNPFDEFVTHNVEPEVEVLEMHEILKMWHTPMPDIGLDEVRDVYIFCVFTGYAYKDSMSLEEDNIFLAINREKFIAKDRTKTDQREMVMLLDIPLQIIEKYKNHKCRIIQAKLLPQLHNSRFNKYLKVIASFCGINKHLTHHTARHTFATTVTLENDVPLETVGKMLGHKSIKSTLRYAKVTKKKIHNNMSVLRTQLQPIIAEEERRLGEQTAV